MDPDVSYGLTPVQREAVFSDVRPLCIVAGAGAGKTRVLTRRIARQILDASIDPAATVAVTFTRKAAAELASRLKALGVREAITCGTFHSVAYRSLRELWALRGRRARGVLADKTAVLARVLEDARLPADRVTQRRVGLEIEWARSHLLDPEAYRSAAAARDTPFGPDTISALYREYQAVKERRGVVDFDDILAEMTTALWHDRAFAHVMAGRLQHVFVDEFQDVTLAQFRLVEAWVRPFSPPDLCVAGDGAQAIFGFNGAQPAFLTNFETVWPDAQVVKLVDNFRCTQPILVAAEAVLPTSPGQTAQRSAADAEIPRIVAHESEEAEAGWIASTLRTTRRPGARWSSQAILVRTNAQIEPLAVALRHAGIPVLTGGGPAFLRRRDVQRVFDALRSSDRPAGQPFAAFVREICAEVDDDGNMPVADVLAELADEFTQTTSATDPRNFAGYVSASLARDGCGPADHDGVHVLTIHRAKGLEFDTVFVAGLEEGLLPIRTATTPDALAEERRLLYVAATRGRRSLALSWAGTRKSGRRLTHRKRSRFLDPVDTALQQLTTGTQPAADWRAWLARTRGQLRTDPQRLCQSAVGGARSF